MGSGLLDAAALPPERARAITTLWRSCHLALAERLAAVRLECPAALLRGGHDGLVELVLRRGEVRW